MLTRIAADRTQNYSLVDREAEPHFRSISVPVRRYDGVIVAAINMGAHVDRVPAQELIERFLPLLRERRGVRELAAAVICVGRISRRRNPPSFKRWRGRRITLR
ncbi:IclR family transcriptional regulator domain-containing protein [Bradyrhizobium betae]